MSRVIYRPATAVDYGQIENQGNGNILGDGNDGTMKGYYEDSGSIMVYPNFNAALVPDGKTIIAVRVAHRQRNGGFLGSANGWVSSYLRIGGSRVPSSRAYKQDGYGDNVREIRGTPLYKSAKGGWDIADLNTMSSDHGAAVGAISPNTKNRKCVATDVFILVVLDDPVPVPTTPFPANGETVSSSSVNFSAVVPATQEEQAVSAIFQVARDADFTTDVRTFAGAFNGLETAGSRSYYTSSKNKAATYTNLGPGKWFLRMKGRDYRGTESATWGATTFFNVSHPALPVPTLTSPAPGSTVSDPYGIRSGIIPTEPSGDRRAGIEFQFSKDQNFASGVISHANQSGRFDPGPISYNAQPDPDTRPGLNGPKVSLEDQDQRLSQGQWYARVRSIDPWSQVSAWSDVYTFLVSHRPSALDLTPKNNQAFDQDELPVLWKFADPWNGDLQTAYQMVVIDANSNILQDTGKVLSAISSAKMNVGPNQLQKPLGILLNVWDLDDVISAQPATSQFFMSKSPAITLTFPAENEAIITGQPEIAWSAVFARADVKQKSFRIRFLESTNLVSVYDTGVVVTEGKVHLPPTPILKNLTKYQLQLTVTDTDNLSKTLKRNFSTNFIRPTGTQSFVEAEDYNDKGYVTVIWSGVPDPFFVKWSVYRRPKTIDNSKEWQLAGEVTSPTKMEFRDWLVAGSGDFEYAVNQVAYRFGSLVESEFEEYPIAVYIYSDAYWFIVPDEEALNTRMFIKADKFTDKEQSNSFVIIGGGLRYNTGPNIGIEGSLASSIRHRAGISASEQMATFRELKSRKGWVLMRDPFGNVIKIAFGEISYDRIAGVGNNEYVDLEIPFYEVR